MDNIPVEKVEPKKFELSTNTYMALFIMMGLGLASFGAGFLVDKERLWHSYLTSYFFFVSLALGGLFFTAIHHAVASGWSVNVRRMSESMTSFLPIALVLGLILGFAGSDLYLWLDEEAVSKDSILQGKSSYLNGTFWVLRLFLFTSFWVLFGKKIINYSVRQDIDGNESWSRKLIPWSVAFLLFFALSYSLFSVDLLMSLEPHWFSTIFGVYCFSGLFQSSLAFMILLSLFCQSKGWVTGLLTIEHIHDLAKLLKGFTVFWAYIAFCQFMLIWYANLPEETLFFLHRSHDGWMRISLALIIFKFIVPFACLLPRWAKRTPQHLVIVCSLILIMQYVDIYWIVYPNYRESVTFSWLELGMFLGFLGLFLSSIAGFLGRNNLIPVKDPRLHESIGHHVIY